jgi:hypothetical protein
LSSPLSSTGLRATHRQAGFCRRGTYPEPLQEGVNMKRSMWVWCGILVMLVAFGGSNATAMSIDTTIKHGVTPTNFVAKGPVACVSAYAKAVDKKGYKKEDPPLDGEPRTSGYVDVSKLAPKRIKVEAKANVSDAKAHAWAVADLDQFNRGRKNVFNAHVHAHGNQDDLHPVGSYRAWSSFGADPDGVFEALDGDDLYNDALTMLAFEPTLSGPIFSGNEAKASAELELSMEILSDFFTGDLYAIDSKLDDDHLTPGMDIFVASGWEIYPILDFTDVDLPDSADFGSAGLTGTEFANLLQGYFQTPNGDGFGGPDPFGVYFVKRNVPEAQLGNWTWNSFISGEVKGAPDAAPAWLLMGLALCGIGAVRWFTRVSAHPPFPI